MYYNDGNWCKYTNQFYKIQLFYYQYKLLLQFIAYDTIKQFYDPDGILHQFVKYKEGIEIDKIWQDAIKLSDTIHYFKHYIPLMNLYQNLFMKTKNIYKNDQIYIIYKWSANGIIHNIIHKKINLIKEWNIKRYLIKQGTNNYCFEYFFNNIQCSYKYGNFEINQITDQNGHNMALEFDKFNPEYIIQWSKAYMHRKQNHINKNIFIYYDWQNQRLIQRNIIT